MFVDEQPEQDEHVTQSEPGEAWETGTHTQNIKENTGEAITYLLTYLLTCLLTHSLTHSLMDITENTGHVTTLPLPPVNPCNPPILSLSYHATLP